MNKEKLLYNLNLLKQKEQQEGNTFKAVAYGKVIKQISQLPKVDSMADLETVTGIGKSIKAKIEELFATGQLQQVEEIKQDPDVPVIEAFMKIYGVGRVKATKLVKEDHMRSLDQLKQNLTLLNEQQQIGLQYYEEFLERIPRAEMRQHDKKLLKFLPPNVEGIVVGSYRRGEPTSGDIDILIKSSSPDDLNKFVATLQAKKYITHTLAHGEKKFMGVCRATRNAKARRLDILLTPPEEYAFALLYFTGSDKHNILMRKKALELGYSLNEHGLTPPPPKQLFSEEDIFAFLQMDFLPPKQRK